MIAASSVSLFRLGALFFGEAAGWWSGFGLTKRGRLPKDPISATIWRWVQFYRKDLKEKGNYTQVIDSNRKHPMNYLEKAMKFFRNAAGDPPLH
jgi:hypothetical protein